MCRREKVAGSLLKSTVLTQFKRAVGRRPERGDLRSAVSLRQLQPDSCSGCIRGTVRDTPAVAVGSITRTMFDDRPDLHALLTSYVRAAEEGDDGRWTQRVSRVRDIAPEDLSALQGEAIALGYLEIDLVDPVIGMKYRVPARVATKLAA